jgi:hypothetical protein
MIPAPKAISHGLGGGAGATLGAFAGTSAANAGEAAEAANAAKSDNTTFFIETAPFIRPARRFPADPLACHLASKSREAPQLRSIRTRFDVRYREI